MSRGRGNCHRVLPALALAAPDMSDTHGERPVVDLLSVPLEGRKT